MKTVTIYGASDDLVEVKGDVPGCDEYGLYDKPGYVELSTGDVFKVEYTDPCVWKVAQVAVGSAVRVEHEPHGEGDDPDPYTETVRVTGDIRWADFWVNWPPTTHERRDRIALHLERHRLTDAEADAVYQILFRKP